MDRCGRPYRPGAGAGCAHTAAGHGGAVALSAGAPAACLSCPFSRHAAPQPELAHILYWKHLERGEIYHCEEQDCDCVGQLIVMSNNCSSWFIKDEKLRQRIENTRQNRDDYFSYSHEVRFFHLDGYIFSAKWLRDRWNRINGRHDPSESVDPVQGELF